MFYTVDFVVEKLKEDLPELEIFVSKQNDNNYYILDFKGYKAKVNIENFLLRLDNEQTENSDRKLNDFLLTIKKNLILQSQFDEKGLTKKEILSRVYPVLRASSFGKNSKQDFYTKEHTNETKIFYSLDFEDSYKILTKDLLKKFIISSDELEESAMANLVKLPLNYNTDVVADNIFYFLNSKDGYDGSRLLDKKVLNYFYQKIGGDFYIGLPHQDSLIIADIKNKKGLEILQKMMVHFFTEGPVPITTITFKYDGKNLESLFIFVE
ncbi:DUF1444 family protein [Gemella sp. zg-1178]|uniref:DUF1444 family protein n=1 Tax=Gemella sp. zg-1178 TaxID=2840372 RepID=UPI001C03C8CE|nr:DUF1444 family protein [Gemella sp. zg-1178]MBU0279269.1 DUF1444 domain-containing protein [Gemella sp. zg-1178]